MNPNREFTEESISLVKIFLYSSIGISIFLNLFVLSWNFLILTIFLSASVGLILTCFSIFLELTLFLIASTVDIFDKPCWFHTWGTFCQWVNNEKVFSWRCTKCGKPKNV